MTKEEKLAKKKIADGKKSTKVANRTKIKNTMKKASDEVMKDLAAQAPAGGANLLKVSTTKILAIREKKRVLNAEERAVFAQLKEAKISIKDYKIALRWAQMEPGDVKAEKATCALYASQMEMELSPEQKQAVDELNEKRDAARRETVGAVGGDSGKEIGSNSASGVQVGDAATGDDAEDGEAQTDGPGNHTGNTPPRFLKRADLSSSVRAKSSVAH